MTQGVQLAQRTRFVSLRWRFLLPAFIVILVAAMAGAYFLAAKLGNGLEMPQINLLIGGARSVSERAAALYEAHRLEAQRIAFTDDVAEAIIRRDPERLQTLVEGAALLAEADSVILTDSEGVAVLGLLRTETADGVRYALGQEVDLSADPVVQGVLDEGFVGAAGLSRTDEGLLLYAGVPVNSGSRIIGTVLVGTRLSTILADLKPSAPLDLALYGTEQQLLQTTAGLDTASPALNLPEAAFRDALSASVPLTVHNFELGGRSYQGAYFPFWYGPQALGVAGVFAPDNLPFIAELGRQMTALTMSGLAAAVVLGIFVALNVLVVGRVNRVTAVAKALAAGESTSRTNMKPGDEIGSMGRALDRYADYVQERQDSLRTALRRQRRETEHLTAVLEALPDGVVVQDADGQIVMMNERAKELLGSVRLKAADKLSELTATVTSALGSSLAPGLYSLGDPRRIEIDGKMVSAQAAAVMNMVDMRVGTVILLRDVTQDIRRERAHEALFTRFEREVQKPLVETIHVQAESGGMTTLARELSRHAVALQKLVVELRDLHMTDAPRVREGQRPLHLDTLVWTIANEWRQVAQAAGLSLDVLIEKHNLYVLGDERRLRWAVGNIIDNAIKYTPHSGKLTLEVQGEANGRALLRVRDNGLGITEDDLPHVFTRFYRGTPRSHDGQIFQVPGTGQGLSMAKQIIEAHGGLIQLKSKPAVGTAVYFALPLTSPVSLELPHLQTDMEGETIPLRTDELRAE